MRANGIRNPKQVSETKRTAIKRRYRLEHHSGPGYQEIFDSSEAATRYATEHGISPFRVIESA